MSAPVDPPEPVAAVEPAAATPPAGPWAADAAEYFGDNAEAIASFDRYMREKQQPYITTLETESAPARELYRDLLANPQETLAEVMKELYAEDDPEIEEKFAKLFEANPEVAAAVVAAEAAPTPVDEPEWAKSARLREEALAEQDAVAAGQAAYDEVLADLRTAHADLTDADMELIHPFMAQAADPEAAYAGYQAFKAQFAATHGLATTEVAETVTAPPVLGSEGTTAATPPTVEKYSTFDAAWDAWRAEEAAAAPPVVGSV